MGCPFPTQPPNVPEGRTILISTSGEHSDDALIQKVTAVIMLTYGPVAFCAKLSLFLLYYRLFSRHQWVRYMVYLGIGFNAAAYTAFTIVLGYLCLPHPGQTWIEVPFSPRFRRSYILIGYVQGPFNLISDLYILLMPLPAVWQLHLPLRKRLGIAGIFLSGSM